jgi:homoserine O-acetyltransferase
MRNKNQADMTMRARFLLALSIAFAVPAVAQNSQQQFASLGDFKLESGEVIRDCRIGYRTFGQLNPEKSNVIIVPTWANGTTAQMDGQFGPNRLIDTTKYYAIAMDALGNGISSSPSNSPSQPHMKFPKFTIRDMVESQHQVLTQMLHIQHVKAVIGASMGGMQTFQWMVTYPDFMDRAIPIVGSPRLAPYDLLFWQTEVDAITSDPGWNHGDYTEQPATTLESELTGLMATTPERFNQINTRDKVSEVIATGKKSEAAVDANNHIRQAEAMMALDVSAPFGGSLERAAAKVKAKVLIIASATDHTVTPGPALDFALLLRAEILELRNECGHHAPECDSAKVNSKVSSFLEEDK